MTKRSVFTPEEWWLLKETPLQAGAAVMVAVESGLGTLQEIAANATGLASARDLFPSNELIAALVAPGSDPDEYKPSPRETAGANRAAREAEITADALAHCARVADVLDRKATAQEAREYKMWIMSIGGDVAAAAKEGGVLGIGAKAINEKEIAMLQQIAQALRYAAYTPPSA